MNKKEQIKEFNTALRTIKDVVAKNYDIKLPENIFDYTDKLSGQLVASSELEKTLCTELRKNGFAVNTSDIYTFAKERLPEIMKYAQIGQKYESEKKENFNEKK